MNGKRAKELRRLARKTTHDSVHYSASPEARAALTRKLYRRLKRLWRTLTAQQRRTFNASNAKGLL